MPDRSPRTRYQFPQPLKEVTVCEGLVIGDNISDPFICCLVDDTGRPCEIEFLGVINFPYPVVSTLTYLQVSRIERFKMHVNIVHRNLQPGTFDTVNGCGRFIASPPRDGLNVLSSPPIPRDPVIPTSRRSSLIASPPRDGLHVLASPPIPRDPVTPTSRRSSLKRRPLESVPEEPDESPLAKRSRPADVENRLDLDVVIEKIYSLAQRPSNEPTRPVPTEEVSKRAPSAPPPPPTAPGDPPSVSRRTPSIPEPTSRPQMQGVEARIEAPTQSVPTEEVSTSRAPSEPPPPRTAPSDPPPVSRRTPSKPEPTNRQSPTQSVPPPLFNMEALGAVFNSLPQIRALEERFQALEDNQTAFRSALRSALSQLMDCLDAMEARPPPPPAQQESEGV